MQYNFYVFTLRQNTYLKNYPVFLLLKYPAKIIPANKQLRSGVESLGDWHIHEANTSHPKRNI